MPDMEKLHLEDTLENSPQTRSLLGVFEKDATMLKRYTAYLHRCCQRLLNAQQELTAATQALSVHLKAYELSKFPLESDDSILISTLKQFSVYLDELSSVQQVLVTQLGDGMMYPLNKFLQADLEEVTTIGNMYQMAGNEHEQALLKFMKLPKKRDNEKLRHEANEDLYAMRKKFHQTSMHYYSSLNALQYKRKCSLLEPLVGYMQAQKTFFGMGHDSVAKTEIEDFLGNISASIRSVQGEMATDTKKTVEMIDSIESQSQHLYYAEPPQDMPYIPPNPSLSQKSGYLLLRSKQALIATKWEWCYFFTQGGNLMCQTKDEVAGSLLLDLNEDGTVAQPADVDDRRFVFQISQPGNKKTVILQAENERERDEWVATINNIAKDSSYTRNRRKERSPSQNSKTKNGGPDSDGSRGGDAGVRQLENKASSQQPLSPSDMFIPDAPIQFDMISPSDDPVDFKANSKEGPPKSVSFLAEMFTRRINPFDQHSSSVVTENAGDNAAFSQTFEVRFLGSMEVKQDRGDPLVLETIRQVMAARAIHNIFRTTESHLLVSSNCMRLIDPSNNTVKTEFRLADISYWAAHTENKRLFGFITRTMVEGKGGPAKYACHVFECNTSGEEICHSISTATKLAFQALMASKADNVDGGTGKTEGKGDSSGQH